MKQISTLVVLVLCHFSCFAEDSPANAETIEAIVAALNQEEAPNCYHFTDEVPPEEFIGLPECSITPSKITGSVEVGVFFNTSDNDYFIAKTRADLVHEVGKLRSNWIIDLFGRKSEKENDETGEKEYETTDQKWFTSLQSNYTLEDGGKNYIFGFSSYEDNRFSGFDYQASVASGWGRRWFESDTSFLDAEVGPGFKVDAIAETDTESNETKKAVIIRAAATFESKFFETLQFKQTFSAEMTPKSGENSKYKSVSSISTKLIERLALKFAFTVDYNTEVEGDTENTHTETSLTLVYSI